MKTNILFVCMGNICRSPTAEAVMRALAAEQGLSDMLALDSAGTHGYHVGAPPDRRSQSAAMLRGYDMSDLRARQVSPEDFQKFDLLLAMDEDNLAWLHQHCPAEFRDKLKLMMEYANTYDVREVPDPYYEDNRGFDTVLNYLEDACSGLLAQVKSQVTAEK